MNHLTFINKLHESLNQKGIDPNSWEIRSIDIIGSTNDEVKKLLVFYDQAVVMAQVQQSGRGRGENIWYSPEGGLWISFGIRRKIQMKELSGPIIHKLQEYLSPYVSTEVKPPNDLLIENKKVCGLLVETSVQNNQITELIIGIGINVINEIPEEVVEIATRLADHCEPPDVIQLGTEIASRLIFELDTLLSVS